MKVYGDNLEAMFTCDLDHITPSVNLLKVVEFMTTFVSSTKQAITIAIIEDDAKNYIRVFYKHEMKLVQISGVNFPWIILNFMNALEELSFFGAEG